MAEHPNAALLRKGHEAFSNGDRATLTEIIAEDALWHVAGKGPFSGDYRGRKAVFGMFDKMAELSGGTIKIKDHDFLGTDQHAVALFKIIATRGGKKLDANYCEVVHWRDGQVVEDWGLAYDQYAFDEFWSS
jgi:ketosteroid isomerase-like protein